MPYRRSRARAQLQIAYADIRGTLRQIDSTRTARSTPKVRDFVIAASIFLAHAELENYVSDLISGFAVAASTHATNGSRLPAMLQSHLFVTRSNVKTIIASTIAGQPEEQMLRGISRFLRNSTSVVNDAMPLSPFSGKDIYATQKYPSKDNLKKVFWRIGIENIFDRISAVMKRDSSAVLESLGSLRTQLAHTASLPGISPRDVRERLQLAEQFVAAIDRVTFREVSTQFGSTSWATHVC